jgi:DNA-directed RNA polymerase subunit H (RpoH/RPB5)
MTPLQTEVFLSDTGFAIEKLPGISSKDALIKYYGYTKRNLIMENRLESVKTYMNSSHYYRVVRDVPIIYETKGLLTEDDDIENEDDDLGEGDEEEEEEPLEEEYENELV